MNLAAPTPPASVVIVTLGDSSDRPGAIGCLSAVESVVSRAAFDRNSTHLASFFFNQIDRNELTRSTTGLGSNTFLHQRAGKIIASELERYRCKLNPEFKPRGLQFFYPSAKEQPIKRI